MSYFLDFTAVSLDQTSHVDICNKGLFQSKSCLLLFKYKENLNSGFCKLFFLSITYFRCFTFIHMYFNLVWLVLIPESLVHTFIDLNGLVGSLFPLNVKGVKSVYLNHRDREERRVSLMLAPNWVQIQTLGNTTMSLQQYPRPHLLLSSLAKRFKCWQWWGCPFPYAVDSYCVCLHCIYFPLPWFLTPLFLLHWSSTPFSTVESDTFSSSLYF